MDSARLVHLVLFLLQITPANGDHSTFILSSVVGTMAVFMGIAGYFVRRRMDEYDRHLIECNKRAVNEGRMEERMEAIERDLPALRGTIERDVYAVRKQFNWIGRCLLILANKLGVELPNQPD